MSGKKPFKKEPWMKDFVRFELTKEQTQAMKSWFSEPNAFERTLEAFLDDDYKITLSRDFNNHAYVARATINDSSSSNSGLMLTGRASTPDRAMAEVLFKHGLLGSDWTSATTDNFVPEW